jgi:hypothetical protein
VNGTGDERQAMPGWDPAEDGAPTPWAADGAEPVLGDPLDGPDGPWPPEVDLSPWALDGWEPSRPRSIRVIGLIAAASLLLATIGTTIGVLMGDSPGSPSLPSRVLSVLPSPSLPASGPGPSELVRFNVANPGRSALEAACEVALDGQRGSVVQVVGLPAGTTEPVSVAVPVASGSFVGSPSDVDVRCVALSGIGPDTN